MKVPLLDLRAQYKKIKDEINDALHRVLENQRFILGPEVNELESWMADYIGTRHAVGVASGSDALLVSLMALGVGTEDAVITTPFTFFATVGSIVRLGATPVFVDILESTYNIDPAGVEYLLMSLDQSDGGYPIHHGKKVRAIIPVHLFGQTADMHPIVSLSKKYNLTIVEDVAQSIGAEYRGKKLGSIGEFGAFSFFPSKNLGGYGDGGMITTNKDEYGELLRVLRVHGAKNKYFHDYVGLNSRLDTIQAAVLLVKAKYIDQWNSMRQAAAERYFQLFKDTPLVDRGLVKLPKVAPYSTKHVWNQFTIRVSNRNELRSYLAEKGVGTGVYYPLSLHLQRCFSYLGYRRGDFPVSEKLQNEVLSIPIYPEISESQQEYVVACILRFYRERGLI